MKLNSDRNQADPQELLLPGPLLDDHGRPQLGGWDRRPNTVYERASIQAPQRRICEWDRYGVFSPTSSLMFEVMDGGYLGQIAITIADTQAGRHTSQEITIPFSLGSFVLPESGDSGTVRIRHKQFSLDFSAMDGGSRIVKVDAPGFGHGSGLRGALVFSGPKDAQSIVTVMPGRKDKNSFKFGRVSPWYIVEGAMQFGDSELVFRKDDSWGVFDWSRGVRSKSSVRYWATACGEVGDDVLSFSLGYNSADDRKGTENAIFVNGQLQKLHLATFRISPRNWMEGWHIMSDDQRLDATFTPSVERSERAGVLFHSFRKRQFFGTFSGTIRQENGSLLEFSGLSGMAERIKIRR